MTTALLSVSDKTGIVEFAQALHAAGVKLLSTGGTAKLLADKGLPVTEVSEVTGFPEMLDGRVKTLHPKIHGGILARRDRAEHLEALATHGIPPIDLVVVALYPFEQTVARPGVTLEEAIEQIDIGGPAMIRAAAKNHASVAVVTHPSQYGAVVAELRQSGELGDATRARLACEAFARTSAYDRAIASYLSDASLVGGGDEAAARTTRFPVRLSLDLQRTASLRYGENPHQQAALYRQAGQAAAGLALARQLQGKELSYNNILDLDSALTIARSLPEASAVVIKHNNPCGAASAATLRQAVELAMNGDPVSAFGSVLGFNQKVDELLQEFNPHLPLSVAWKESLIIRLYNALGIPSNRNQMESLGRQLLSAEICHTSLEEFIRYAEQSAASPLRDGCSIEWVRSGMRPASRPTARIPQAAALHYRIHQLPFDQFFRSGVSSWQALVSSIPADLRPGTSRLSLLRDTVFLPSIYLLGDLFQSKELIRQAYGNWENSSQHVPEEVLTPFQRAGYNIPSPDRKLGLAHQYKRYCLKRNCHRCEVFKSAIRS